MVFGRGGALMNEVSSDDLVYFPLYQTKLPDYRVGTRDTEFLQQYPVYVTRIINVSLEESF